MNKQLNKRHRVVLWLSFLAECALCVPEGKRGVLLWLLAAAAFVLKSVGGEWYDTAREWYFEQLNDTAVFDGSRDVDLQRLSGTATADEI